MKENKRAGLAVVLALFLAVVLQLGICGIDVVHAAEGGGTGEQLALLHICRSRPAFAWSVVWLAGWWFE